MSARADVTTLLEEVVALEIEMLDPKLRRAGSDPESLLHPQFTELSPTGRVYNRSSVATAPVNDTPEGVRVDHLAAQQVCDGAILVTYRSRRGERQAWWSSLWLRTDAGWLLRHHQGTPIRGIMS